MSKTQLSKDFQITAPMRAWAGSRIPSVDIDREHESFCDYWWSRGRQMADWEACWRMWMRRAPQMGGAMKPRIPLALVTDLAQKKAMPR